MSDIYDAKYILLGDPISIIYSVVFVLFIIIMLFLFKYFNKKEVVYKEKKLNYVEEEIKYVNYIKIFENLEENYKNLKPEVFYKELSFIIRWYLEQERNVDNISKMTFREIRKLKLDKRIEKLIENIYFKEFSKNILDNEEIRKEIMLAVKTLIFK